MPNGLKMPKARKPAAKFGVVHLNLYWAWMMVVFQEVLCSDLQGNQVDPLLNLFDTYSVEKQPSQGAHPSSSLHLPDKGEDSMRVAESI